VLPAGALARVGADSAGSRALEALFAGAAAPAKTRRRALKRLSGRMAALAAEPGGSHVVQAAYAAAVRACAAAARPASPHRRSPRPGLAAGSRLQGRLPESRCVKQGRGVLCRSPMLKGGGRQCVGRPTQACQRVRRRASRRYSPADGRLA